MNHRQNCTLSLVSVLQSKPQAVSRISGSLDFSEITGHVRFYQTNSGVIVYADIWGLPDTDSACGQHVFGFHIHAGDSCTGTTDDPFADTGSHYNPAHCDHPNHAGNMPPLFGNHGHAISLFLTNRFSIKDVIGRTVVVHRDSDDFMTQSSGHAGMKIACGVIRSACC